MSKQKAKPIAYVVHPITPEQKQAIVREGFKIIDAKFAPEGAEIVDFSKAGEAEKAPEKMTVAELTERLQALGIEIPEGAKKADLVELLTQADAE